MLDDKFEFNPIKKILLIIFSIFLFVYFSEFSLVKKAYLENGFIISLNNLSLIFTIFCIFTLTLTLNMFDGIDGQSLILYIFLLIYLFFFHNILFCAYLIIPLIVILILNLNQKLYLGDNGVMVFSSILSVIIIKYNFLNHGAIYVDEILLILIIPALDLIRLFFYRIYIKKNPLNGDSMHIHHLITKHISKNKYIFFSIIFYSSLLFLMALKINFIYLIVIVSIIYTVLLSWCFKKKTIK